MAKPSVMWAETRKWIEGSGLSKQKLVYVHHKEHFK